MIGPSWLIAVGVLVVGFVISTAFWWCADLIIPPGPDFQPARRAADLGAPPSEDSLPLVRGRRRKTG